MDPDAVELRALGALIEKERTTPDAYPLTLNALRLACNQATNREPVVDYDEAALREACQRLAQRGWARLAGVSRTRSPKYRQLIGETLGLGRDELAVLCVLLLRGPQTPGELKQRSDRLHAFAELDAVQATLERLIERGLAARLERRPGQKELRYAHRLAEEPDAREAAAPPPAWPPPATSPPDPLAALEARVAALERELAELRAARGA